MFRICLNIIIFLAISSISYGEGTKELRPTSADFGDIEIGDGSSVANPLGRPFARTDNTDTLHRLYIHVKNISETIYFGFQPTTKTLGKGKFRIKDPSGNIVYALTDVPIASGVGYIETYNEAVAGPKIGGLPATGYNPFSLTPTTTGDYYIEFEETVTDGNGTYYFDLFDITVVNASNTPLKGRLWSYAWDLSARGGTNEMETIFYIYTKDKYISSVDMNGIQPFGFVISCNSTGTYNTGNLFADRQSVTGNHTYPEFKIFLNMPDTTVYDIAVPPAMIEDLAVIGTPVAEQNVLFYLNMSKGGTIEIFLDLDGIPGFQPNGDDVVIVQQIKSGGDTIVWNGKDGTGDFVQGDVIVGMSSRFATGVTHLPLYDPEFHTNGFIVNRVRPSTELCELYWDDSQLPSALGTTEFEGNTIGHIFPDTTGGFGNVRSINTWWNGFEIDDLKSFSFSMNGMSLPITLTKWQAINKGDYVQLLWSTSCEINNDYFEIQRSSDGINWESIQITIGMGNSKTTIYYSEIDEYPLSGISYYKLKQIDVSGAFSFSPIIAINKCIPEGYINVIYNRKDEIVTIEGDSINFTDISIKNIQGISVTDCIIISQISKNFIKLNITAIPNGIYIINSKKINKLFYKK